MSRRTEMLGSTIQRELAEVIQRDLVDPRLTGFPSITRVKIAPDLSIADVYVTVMGTPGQQTACLNALKHSAGLMRGRLTKALSLRVAPFLKFHIDEDIRKEIAVLDLIRKATEEEDALARKRAGIVDEPEQQYESAPDDQPGTPEAAAADKIEHNPPTD